MSKRFLSSEEYDEQGVVIPFQEPKRFLQAAIRDRLIALEDS
jgi:hypothetical protein